jgi:hypothetical protein
MSDSKNELATLRDNIVQARLQRIAGHPEEATEKEVAALAEFVLAVEDSNPTFKTAFGILRVASAYEELSSAVGEAVLNKSKEG